MVETAALHQEIIALFANHLNVDVPSAETDIVGSGLLDSLGLVELLALIEQQYDVKISLDDLEIDHFRSVASIADLVRSLQFESKAA